MLTAKWEDIVLDGGDKPIRKLRLMQGENTIDLELIDAAILRHQINAEIPTANLSFSDMDKAHHEGTTDGFFVGFRAALSMIILGVILVSFLRCSFDAEH
jgi:hypothetical protein